MAWFQLPLLRSSRRRLIGVVLLIVGLSLAVAATTFARKSDAPATDPSTQARWVGDLYYPAPKQWAAFKVEAVSEQIFQPEHMTEGKIAVDEDRSTLVYSPYAGRVIRLLSKPGDMVGAGQALFVVESPDMVQAQNDFISATVGLNKAQSALDLAKLVEQQNRSLYETKAGPLRDLQQAQASTLAAKNDLHAAQISLEAVRNRLRILGKTDDEIKKFSEAGIISPQTTIYSPIAGTVVQRRVGPGQYVNTTSNSAGASDATFIIGDLSTVWLVAYVRETEAQRVRVGQSVRFSVIAYPDRVFGANIDYLASSLDSGTRRLLARATVNNAEGMLRPEMFASVTILTGDGDRSPAVPRKAIIYDGNTTRVWVARNDHSVEERLVKTGGSNGTFVQIVEGLSLGEKIVTEGSLFMGRAGAAS